MKYKFGSLVKNLDRDKVDIDYYKEGGVINNKRMDKLIEAAKLQTLQDGGNIARTPEEFKLGILAGKTVFPFGKAGPKPMTMKTPIGTVPYPIEYRGFTNNQLTDYGIAMPGDDFIVEGDTVVENKLYDNKYMHPNKKYMMKGGRIYKLGGNIMQKGGYTDPTLEGLQNHLNNYNQEASQGSMSGLPRPYTTRIDPNQENRLKAHYGPNYEDMRGSFNEGELTQMMGNELEVTGDRNKDLQDFFGEEFENMLDMYTMEELRAMKESGIRPLEVIPQQPIDSGSTIISAQLPPVSTPADLNRSRTMYGSQFIPPPHQTRTREITEGEFNQSWNNPFAIRTESDALGDREWSQRSTFSTTLGTTDEKAFDARKPVPERGEKATGDNNLMNIEGNLYSMGFALPEGRLTPEGNLAFEGVLGPGYSTQDLDNNSGFNTTQQQAYSSILQSGKALQPGFINFIDGVADTFNRNGVNTPGQISAFLNSTQPGTNVTRAQHIQSVYGIDPQATTQLFNDIAGNDPLAQQRFALFRDNVRRRADVNGLLQIAAQQDARKRGSNETTNNEISKGQADAFAETINEAKKRYSEPRLSGNPSQQYRPASTTLMYLGQKSSSDPGLRNMIQGITGGQQLNETQIPGAFRNYVATRYNNPTIQDHKDVLDNMIFPIQQDYSQALMLLSAAERSGNQDRIAQSKADHDRALNALLAANGFASKMMSDLKNDEAFTNDRYLTELNDARENMRKAMIQRRTNSGQATNQDVYVQKILRSFDSDYDLALANLTQGIGRTTTQGRGMNTSGGNIDPVDFLELSISPQGDGLQLTRDNMFQERFRPSTSPVVPPPPRPNQGTTRVGIRPPDNNIPTRTQPRPARTTGGIQTNRPAQDGNRTSVTTNQATQQSRQSNASGINMRTRVPNPSLNRMRSANNQIRKEGGMIYNTGQTIKYKSGGIIKTGVIKRYNPNTNEIELY